MFKPTRGPQRPKMQNAGISHWQLIKFLSQCEEALKAEGEEDSAFRFEMLKEYFSRDYEEGKSLVYKGQAIGL